MIAVRGILTPQLNDDALDGTLLVAHPDLDITEMVTARMTLPE